MNPDLSPALNPDASLRRLHGSDDPLQRPLVLNAGPVTASLDGIELRYIRLAGTELIRRIYVAVRDRNWNTIPAVASGIEVVREPDAFTVRFSVRHASTDIEFDWTGVISGDSDGRIRLEMDGSARREMLYNRIGFCVLHPPRESCGARFRGLTPDGTVSGVLPDTVAAQRFEDGVYVALFPAVSSLEIDLAGDCGVSLEFEGDLFETEDQRNWSDASLKTYCTPLALGFPHRLTQGERRAQAVTVSPRPYGSAGAAVGSRPAGAQAVALQATVGPVGLSLSAECRPTEAEAALLQLLGPAHLRHELQLSHPDWRQRLQAAAEAAAMIVAPLELALFLAPTVDDNALRALGGVLREIPLARVLVAVAQAQTATALETTPGPLVARARELLALADDVPVAGGTDMYFCELNRTRPQVSAMDGVFWSINPQVHAFDDLSLIETAEAQAHQVRTARTFADGKPVFVGPITLRRRYNVNATVVEGGESGELPDSVDPRQASLLGAAWTLASAQHLFAAGASTATYFETVGFRGVMHGEREQAIPGVFASTPGEVFPLFHVLADLCELRGATLTVGAEERPRRLCLMVLERHGQPLTVLAANLTPEPIAADISALDGRRGRLRRLNANTVALATREPRAFRAGYGEVSVAGIELEPYETIRIELEDRDSDGI